MIRVNADPHTRGYVYFPARAVSGFFPAGRNPNALVQALTDAGFANDRIDVFTGDQGAELLDVEGQHHGLWVRLMRSLEDTFTDDAYLFHNAEQTLRSGGSVVAVFTHGQPEERQRAADIMKAHGGQDVTYWGRWVTETM